MSSNIKHFFLVEVEKAIEEVNSLIEERRKDTTNGVEKSHELQAVLNDLRKIKFQLITDSIPPKSSRFLSYESFITETWGIRHPLGSKLLDIATKYTYAL